LIHPFAKIVNYKEICFTASPNGNPKTANEYLAIKRLCSSQKVKLSMLIYRRPGIAPLPVMGERPNIH
jgi:hypothetical protein